jgi:hypothetical protein
LILTAILLSCCTTLSAHVPSIPDAPPAIALKLPASAEPAKEAEHAKPDAPAPKAVLSSVGELELEGGSESITPGSQPILNPALKPVLPESYETPRKRKIWYGLMVAGHGAAGFDAWTTRRALSGGYGVESDPLQRPFAHSGALYATTQVSPLIMDYLGHRMMRSRYPLLRRMWWLPQAAGAGFSLGAGIHNYGVVH